MKKHGKVPIARVRETAKYYRYRLEEPDDDATYRLKTIKDGVKIVFEPSALRSSRQKSSTVNGGKQGRHKK